MTTAQDQQSRAEFEKAMRAEPNHWVNRDFYRDPLGVDLYEDRGTQAAWSAWQAARALPARGVDPMLDTPAVLEPVATIASIDEHGPCFGWHQHWANFPVGTKLYAAAPVQAMLEHAGAGRGAESEGKPPQTRMDTGAHPGAGLPPDQSPCRRNLFYNGPSNCLIGTVGCFVDSHRGRGRQPAAPATTEPLVPTTGALQPHEQLTDAEIIHALETRRRQSDFYQSRIGLACTQCTDGKYRADSNGYNAFHRCDKCLHVPMWMVDSTELVAPIK